MDVHKKIEYALAEIKTKKDVYELIQLDEKHCSIFSFTLVHVPKHGDVVELICKEAKFNDRIFHLLKSATKGSKFYLEKFDSLGDCIHFQLKEPIIIISIK